MSRSSFIIFLFFSGHNEGDALDSSGGLVHSHSSTGFTPTRVRASVSFE